jgi:adenylate cyclase class 2
VVYEVEAKFRIKCSIEDMISRLSSLGFSEKDSFQEIDTYYNHPCRDFGRTDEALRIRKRVSEKTGHTACLLTYKGGRVVEGLAKKREELEIVVGDCSVMESILLRLGFKKVKTIVKNRIIYGNHDLEITLDNLHGIGWFMEIEAGRDIVEKLYRELRGCLNPVHKTYLEICIETGRCGDV